MHERPDLSRTEGNGKASGLIGTDDKGVVIICDLQTTCDETGSGRPEIGDGESHTANFEITRDVLEARRTVTEPEGLRRQDRDLAARGLSLDPQGC